MLIVPARFIPKMKSVLSIRRAIHCRRNDDCNVDISLLAHGCALHRLRPLIVELQQCSLEDVVANVGPNRPDAHRPHHSEEHHMVETCWCLFRRGKCRLKVANDAKHVVSLELFQSFVPQV